MANPKLLAFTGSLRAESINKKMLSIAATGAEEAGADVTLIDLKDYELPLYDEDIEANEGYPDKALELKKLMQQSDVFLISSPEYNSSYSAVLKNIIDWASRPTDEGEAMLSAFAGKSASIMAASPGALGGIRGLFALRDLLMNIQIHVHPNMFALGGSHKEFNEDGTLNSAATEARIKVLGSQTVAMIK